MTKVTAKMQARGVLTLPKKIRDKFGLSQGSLVDVEEKNGTLLIKPISRLDTVLQNDVRMALEDLKKRNYVTFSSANEFHKERKKKWGRA